MVDDHEPVDHPDIDPVDYEKTPWMFKEVRRMRFAERFKLLFIGGLVILGIYIMFQWFGWYFLFGLIPAPLWYFWALRQIDKESYILIEIRIKGDKYDEGKVSKDTQTNIYQIPPDIWKEMTFKGNPYYAGSRIYICDHYKEDDEGKGTVYFADHEQLANMNFFAKAQLWLDTKELIPQLQKELAFAKYEKEIQVNERTIDWLEEMGILEVNKILKGKKRVVKKESVEPV